MSSLSVINISFNCFGTCFNICSILKSKPNIKIPSHLVLPYFLRKMYILTFFFKTNI